MRRWMTAILILPGTFVVVVPTFLLYLFRNSPWHHTPVGVSHPAFWIAFLFILGGLSLSTWAASLFFRFGEGTPAPWDPPKHFVVRGPYRHVRNPMLTGAFLILFSESLFFGSWPVFAWALFFVAVNTVYIPLVEEQGLKKRFGEAYLTCKWNVPRWIPRWTPWEH